MTSTWANVAVDLARAAAAIAHAHEAGHEIVTVTVLTGAAAGKRYLSSAAGAIEGTVDADLDDRARLLADSVWQSRTHAMDGILFAELHTLAEPLVIFGAGHIAVALANIACDLGFDVTVLDDREDFATPARFHQGVHVELLDFKDPLRGIDIDKRTFVVMVTRAHKYDFDCLQAVLQLESRPRYIGMIGSKRRVRAAFKALLDAGVSRDSLACVHAPVGVDIGAETPAEIAVSIAAELIQVRRNAKVTSMSSEARVLERMLPEAAAQ